MDIVSRREHDGTTVLAIDTGMTAKSFSHSRVRQSLTKPGFLLSADGTLSEWLILGTFCDEDRDMDRFGRIFAYGPDFAGRSLASWACSGEPERAWATLHRCMSSVRRAAQISDRTDGLNGMALIRAVTEAGPGAIFCGEDGSILVLPPEVYVSSLSSHGEGIEADERLRWTDPRIADPGRSLGFMTGALAYRIISGHAPFDPRLESQIVRNSDMNPKASLARLIETETFMPLGLECPGLRQSAAQCVDSLITPSRAASIDTLMAFGSEFTSLFDPRNDHADSDPAILHKREQYRKQIAMSVKKHDFLRKHKKNLILFGAIFLLVGIVSFTWITDVLSRPTTAGLEPVAVVAGYYRALAELNQEIPGAFTKRSVQTEYDTLTTTIFVTSRVRSNYEQKTGLITPALLFAAGTRSGSSIYGMTGFTAAERERSDSKATFGVSFYYWIPIEDSGTGIAPDPESPEPCTVYRYRDTVELEFFKDRWLITRIIPDERTPVADIGSILEILAAGNAGTLPYAPSSQEISRAAESIRNAGP